MKLKQKAGLALALAAIFTTAGANMALADNVTNGGTVPNSGANTPVELIGSEPNPTISGGNSTIQKIIAPTTVQSVTVTKTSLTLTGDGTALVGNGNVPVPVLTIDGATPDDPAVGVALNLTGGSGTLNTLNLNNEAELNVGQGSYTLANLNADTATQIKVGNNAQSGQLVITGNADLNGSTVFVDPAWYNGNTPQDASSLVINNFAAGAPDTINGILVAGRNSQISLGQPNADWMNRAVASTGWWLQDGTGVTAALGLSRPFNLGADALTGSILVDGSLTSAADDITLVEGLAADGTATFANNSLLVVDVATGSALTGATGQTVSIGGPGQGTTATVAAGPAYLYVVNGRVGTTQILSGFDADAVTVETGGAGSWSGDYLLFDNILLEGTGGVTGGTGTAGTGFAVTATNMDARAVLPINGSLANTLNSMMANGLNDVDSELLDVRYISRALSRMYGASDPTHAARDAAMNIEGIAAAAAVAGVPYASYNIASTVSDIINGRASTLNRVASAAAGGPEGEWGIWLKPFYSYSDVDGLKVGKTDGRFETSYGGAVLGFDYNVHQDFNLGLAFNVGGGDTKSKGDFAETKSDFDFWGVTLYGAYTFGDWGVIGDVGYSSSSHDLTQRTNRTLGLPNLKGDVDTDAMSVGLTAEYVFRNQWGINIAPHLGVRWTSLKMDDYNMKARGLGDVVRSSMDRQNIWTIPIGVTFSNEYITSGGWMISPLMDVGLVVAAGDTDNDHKYRFANLGSGTIDAEIVDDVAFNGLLGIKAKADNGFSVGIDYNIKASDNMTSHSFAGMLRYEF